MCTMGTGQAPEGIESIRCTLSAVNKVSALRPWGSLEAFRQLRAHRAMRCFAASGERRGRGCADILGAPIEPGSGPAVELGWTGLRITSTGQCSVRACMHARAKR